MDAGDLIVIGPIDSSGAPTVFLHRFCKRARRSAKRTKRMLWRLLALLALPHLRVLEKYATIHLTKERQTRGDGTRETSSTIRITQVRSVLIEIRSWVARTLSGTKGLHPA